MPKAVMYTTKSGKRRFQVASAVSEEVWESLREMAYLGKTTVSAQVRRAVEEYVARNRPGPDTVAESR